MKNEFGLWEDLAKPAVEMPILDNAIETDVVIIGAGYTGLSTALHLAEQGHEPVILEAQQPGWGGSGRNTGWMEPNWWMKQPADIRTCFGAQLGEELTKWVASGPELLKGWISGYRMDFDFSQRGLIMATDSPAKADAMKAEVRDWQAVGVNNTFLDAKALSAQISSDRYCGAILLHDGATINPLALSRELARACITQGVNIYAQTPALSVSHQAGWWQIETPGGSVSSRQLVLATDAYTYKLWPSLRAAYYNWNVAVVASKPYSALPNIMLSGIPFADLNMANIFTLRTTADGRLVTSIFSPTRQTLSPEALAEPFMRKFRKVFPGQPEPQWEYAHYGKVGISRDYLPRICSIGPNAWTAYGYSGTGINLSLLMGGQLARLVAGSGDTLYPVTELQPLSIRKPVEWGLRYLHAPISRQLLSRWV